jgi:hypothetical protein
MCPRKLLQSDKDEILDLYRNSPETTSTLATRYDVSSSTISRLLKKNLSDQEYEDLIQEKRLSRANKPSEQLILTLADVENEEDTSSEVEEVDTEEDFPTPSSFSALFDTSIPDFDQFDQSVAETPLLEVKEQEEDQAEEDQASVSRRRRRRSSSLGDTDTSDLVMETTIPELKSTPSINIQPPQVTPLMEIEEEDEDEEETMSHETVLALQEFLGEELEDPEDSLEDDEDEDDEDEDDEDEDDEDFTPMSFNTLKEGDLSISPLENASFPKNCYIVVDRAAELITRPLQDFRELGLIPPEEFSQKTLPVFENHRVARRFSKRRERVIKIPDGRLLKKTSPYLASKGITRLLFDGQVYALSLLK